MTNAENRTLLYKTPVSLHWVFKIYNRQSDRVVLQHLFVSSQLPFFALQTHFTYIFLLQR